MAGLSLREAAQQTGSNKSTIWRAIKSGRLSATRLDGGGFAIDPAELFRVLSRNSQNNVASNIARDRTQRRIPAIRNGQQRPQRTNSRSRSSPSTPRSGA